MMTQCPHLSGRPTRCGRELNAWKRSRGDSPEPTRHPVPATLPRSWPICVRLWPHHSRPSYPWMGQLFWPGSHSPHCCPSSQPNVCIVGRHNSRNCYATRRLTHPFRSNRSRRSSKRIGRRETMSRTTYSALNCRLCKHSSMLRALPPGSVLTSNTSMARWMPVSRQSFHVCWALGSETWPKRQATPHEVAKSLIVQMAFPMTGCW